MKISPRILHFAFISSLALVLVSVWSPTSRAEMSLEDVYELEETVNSFYGQKPAHNMTKKEGTFTYCRRSRELACQNFQMTEVSIKEKREQIGGHTTF